MLATNFGSLCPEATNFGSQNLGYQIWFCTRLYINNTWVICCRVQGRPHWTTDHKGVVDITPDYPWSIPIITWLNNFVSNIYQTKYVQILYQIEWHRLHCDVTYFSLMTRVVAYTSCHEGSKSIRNVKHVKLCGQFMKKGSSLSKSFMWNHQSPYTYMKLIFRNISHKFKHYHNDSYGYWHRKGGWHALSIVTHANAWRQAL